MEGREKKRWRFKRALQFLNVDFAVFKAAAVL